MLAGYRRAPLYARLALAWVGLYLTLAGIQHLGALRMAEDLATARGHEIERLTVKPTFGNILVWKSVYETDGRFYLDGFRVGIAPAVYPGPSVARLDPARDFPGLSPASQQYGDLLRFDRFSQGYAARNPQDPEAVIDVRYSFLPNEVGALWSIVVVPGRDPDRHVGFQTNRRRAGAHMTMLWHLITGPPQP